MNIPNEVIFGTFGVLSTVIVFLFKSYRGKLESLELEMRRRIDNLNQQVIDLRNERAELMLKLGELKGENQALRDRICFLEGIGKSASSDPGPS